MLVLFRENCVLMLALRTLLLLALIGFVIAVPYYETSVLKSTISLSKPAIKVGEFPTESDLETAHNNIFDRFEQQRNSML